MTSPRPKRQSAAVYRRRRLVVGVLAVVLVVLLWWLASSLTGWFSDEQEGQSTSGASEMPEDPASQPSEQGEQSEQGEPGEQSPGREDASGDQDGASGDQDGGDSTGNSTEGSAENSTGEDELPGGDCARGDIEVNASTGEDSYSPDEAPLLIMQIEHTGDQSCTLDVGTVQQDFSVSHADREVFTTEQCADGGESHALEIEPGQVETARLDWPRSDSAENCTEPAELAPGDYELVVSLGEVSSAAHEFTLTED